MTSILQWFDSYSFVFQVALVAIAWALCQLHSHWLAQAVAKALLPWLIGMSIVLAIFFAAKEWLPKSDYASIVRLETGASQVEEVLDKLFPYPFIQSLGLLIVLTTLNIRYPTWKPWSSKLEKALSIGAKTIAVLSVFTSFTFFATGHGNIVAKATAKEKYERVKDQANACASLIIGARLTEDAKAEAKSTRDFLDAVANQLSLDARLPLPAGLLTRSGNITRDKEEWRQSVQQHVEELLKARDAVPTIGRMAYTIDKNRLADMISRRFTKVQIKEANEQFEKALDIFVEKGADISIHPLTKLLESLGLPELPEAIVHKLYTSEISHLAEMVTRPLADSLFRHDAAQADSALANFSESANRPVFDVAALPSKLVNPTIGDRSPELATREKEEERAAERAAREIERLGNPKYEMEDIARRAAKDAAIER